MLKQYVLVFFLSFFSLISSLAVAETVNANIKPINIKPSAVALALNKGDSKYSLRSSKDVDTSQLEVNLNTVKSQNAVLKPETSNSEQSGWLLAFALFGFVMLSNRRGV